MVLSSQESFLSRREVEALKVMEAVCFVEEETHCLWGDLGMSEALEISEISREKVSDPEEREKEDSDLKERRSRERSRVKKSEKGWIFEKLEQ